ncbi:hypothetical protein KFU94_48345 [Chloroflexi bacterium TSY]|nr:hypothetical protein [Chloroflexi bacterium TSY]
MRNRILIVTIILASLIGWINSQPVITELIFIEGTTLEQASSQLKQFEAIYEGADELTTRGNFVWSYEFGNQQWSGGIRFDPSTDDINQACNQHAQQYIRIIEQSLADLQSGEMHDLLVEANGGKRHPTQQKQIDQTQQEYDRLQEEVNNCWTTNICPSIPIYRVTAILENQQQVNQIQSLTTIAEVNAQSITERLLFFQSG